MRSDLKADVVRSRCVFGSDARGFTLLEVTIAVAIAGLAFVAMFQAGSTGLLAANTAARFEEAIERAQSHLAAFGRAAAVVPEESEGDDGGGYHWRLRARPLAAHQLAQAEQNAPAANLYDVEVLISWHAGDRTHSVVLHTRRLGVAVAPQ